MSKIILSIITIVNFIFPILCTASESLLLNISSDNPLDNRIDRENYQLFANFLNTATNSKIRFVVGETPTTSLQRTRTGDYAILFGQAHIIASALRYGYRPIAQFDTPEKIVFVVPPNSPIKSLVTAQGYRLGLPSADSLVTYLALGEISSLGFDFKKHFKNVRFQRFDGSALYSMAINQVDLVAVDELSAKEWISKNGGAIIKGMPLVPGYSLAINPKKISPGLEEKLKSILLGLNTTPAGKQLLARLKTQRFDPVSNENFAYVANLGYHTPKFLVGVFVVSADEVIKLTANKKTTLFDVRSESEYANSHIKGAINVPYFERSAKEVAFDPRADSFDIKKLPLDKNSSIIFSCNGPECWKSYKSAKLARDLGYRNVFWFRGGYPEWAARGYPLN